MARPTSTRTERPAWPGRRQSAAEAVVANTPAHMTSAMASSRATSPVSPCNRYSFITSVVDSACSPPVVCSGSG